MDTEVKEKKKWYEYPQSINSWNSEIDYVMFVDENNSVDKQKIVYNKIINKQQISVDEKYFTVTGCIFERKNYSKMRNEIRKLKNKYWDDGYYFDSKANETRYVCLHSRDIRRHDGAFNDKLINYPEFMNELSDILTNIECKIISVTINIEEFIHHGYTYNIYEKAFDFLLERLIYATDTDKKGIIMLESRGKRDDKNLLEHIKYIILEKGTNKIPIEEMNDRILGVYFNPKWYSKHISTFAGLEVTDLFSYPIHQFVKNKKRNKSFDVIETKLHGYPNYDGKGLKIFPKEKNDTNRP